MAKQTAPATAMEFDWDEIDPQAQDVRSEVYPYVQWVNGDKKLSKVGGVAYTGGFAYPVEQDSSIRFDGWKADSLTFDNGEMAVLATKQSRFAVIRSRFCWFKREGKNIIRFARNEYQPGLRGWLQALVVIPGYDGLVMLTLKGMVAESFNRAMDAHWSRFVSVANRTAPQGRKLPQYAFYAELRAGAFKTVGSGEKSEITPIELVLPEKIERQALVNAYIGKERLIQFQEYWRSTKEWKEAWDKGGEENLQHEWACGTDLANQFQDLIEQIKLSDGQATVNSLKQQILATAGVKTIADLNPGQMMEAIEYLDLQIEHRARMKTQAPIDQPPIDDDINF